MRVVSVLVVMGLTVAAPAFAQRYPFERTFDVTEVVTLDAITERGKIEVLTGDPDRVVVTGVVTVRATFNVPTDAPELARQLAANPPVQHAGGRVELRPPSDPTTRRGVTVSYVVRVPPSTIVETTSDSGETSIRGVSGAVRVQTQSSAITLESLGGATTVRTGSGAVRVDRIRGALDVTTSSSGFTGHRLGSSFRLRTQSGAVDAEFDGSGDVDVDSGSSAIRLHRVRGGLTAKSGSGQVTIYGTPGSEWLVTTRSSKIEVYVDASDGFALDADSRSGDVEVVGLTVNGTVAKRGANGAVAGGGPRMRLSSGSGAIKIQGER